MFRALCAHHQEVKIVQYHTASSIITSVGGRPVHRLREDVHRLREGPSLNLCTGRPPTGVMIPDAV